MIQIDNILVSDDVVEAKFVCDLHKCKGGCCEDGDAGAPLEDDELPKLEQYYEAVKPYMTPEGIAAVDLQGKYVHDGEFGWVTPTVGGAICAYGFRDPEGVIKCAIEAAYYDGKLDWKKPISCHLFPIRVSESKAYTMLNYEPRETLCRAACTLGKKAKMPVYQFLREPLTRKFGAEFYGTLEKIAHEYFEPKDTTKPKRK
ncbi:MAG TPA: DUF3109 family protein [Chitinophagaceae bacterium]|nr:DUF3109 family protein [Chitinophagaceae bacterium]